MAKSVEQITTAILTELNQETLPPPSVLYRLIRSIASSIHNVEVSAERLQGESFLSTARDVRSLYAMAYAELYDIRWKRVYKLHGTFSANTLEADTEIGVDRIVRFGERSFLVAPFSSTSRAGEEGEELGYVGGITRVDEMALGGGKWIVQKTLSADADSPDKFWLELWEANKYNKVFPIEFVERIMESDKKEFFVSVSSADLSTEGLKVSIRKVDTKDKVELSYVSYLDGTVANQYARKLNIDNTKRITISPHITINDVEYVLGANNSGEFEIVIDGYAAVDNGLLGPVDTQQDKKGDLGIVSSAGVTIYDTKVVGYYSDFQDVVSLRNSLLSYILNRGLAVTSGGYVDLCESTGLVSRVFVRSEYDKYVASGSPDDFEVSNKVYVIATKKDRGVERALGIREQLSLLQSIFDRKSLTDTLVFEVKELWRVHIQGNVYTNRSIDDVDVVDEIKDSMAEGIEQLFVSKKNVAKVYASELHAIIHEQIGVQHTEIDLLFVRDIVFDLDVNKTGKIVQKNTDGNTIDLTMPFDQLDIATLELWAYDRFATYLEHTEGKPDANGWHRVATTTKQGDVYKWALSVTSGSVQFKSLIEFDNLNALTYTIATKQWSAGLSVQSVKLQQFLEDDSKTGIETDMYRQFQFRCKGITQNIDVGGFYVLGGVGDVSVRRV